MRGKAVNINDAKANLSRLINRVERGGRIVITRAGKPVAELRPMPRKRRRSIPLDDPLLRVGEYSYEGPIASMTNRELDSTVYGIQPSL